MDSNGESDLIAHAEEAEREERARHAAFLYEQARRIALDRRQPARAYKLGKKAAQNWNHAGEHERLLALLLELLTDVPPDVDPTDIYLVRQQCFYYYWSNSISNLSVIEAERAAVSAAYEELNLGGPDSHYYEGLVLASRGRNEEAYDCFEVAYSRWTTDEFAIKQFAFASRCAIMAIKLDRLDAANGWIDKITSSSLSLETDIHRIMRRMQLAVRSCDVSASRVALLDLDEAMAGIQRDRWTAEIDLVAIAALCLDTRYGDPGRGSHPATRRLDDFPTAQLRVPHGQELRAHTVLIHRMAALRYAAGMPPDQDCWPQPPHVDPAGYPPRIPAELPARVAAARRACDAAAEIVARVDAVFECDFRQRRVANLRRRIEGVARVHSIFF